MESHTSNSDHSSPNSNQTTDPMSSPFDFISKLPDKLPSTRMATTPLYRNRIGQGRTDGKGEQAKKEKQALKKRLKNIFLERMRKKQGRFRRETKQTSSKEAKGESYQGKTSTTSSQSQHKNKDAASKSAPDPQQTALRKASKLEVEEIDIIDLCSESDEEASSKDAEGESYQNKTSITSSQSQHSTREAASKSAPEPQTTNPSSARKLEAEETGIIDLCSESDEEEVSKQRSARPSVPTLRKDESSLKRDASFSIPNLKRLKSDVTDKSGSENDSFSTAPEEPFEVLPSSKDIVQSIEISPSPILGSEVPETLTQCRLTSSPSQKITTIQLSSERSSTDLSADHSEGKAQPLPTYLTIKLEEENSQPSAETSGSEISFPARTPPPTKDDDIQLTKNHVPSENGSTKEGESNNNKATIPTQALADNPESVIETVVEKPLSTRLVRPNRSWIERHPTRRKSPSEHVATRSRYPRMPKRPVLKRPIRKPRVHGTGKLKESQDVYANIDESSMIRSWSEDRTSRTENPKWTFHSEFANEPLSICDALDLQVKDEECDAAFSSLIEDSLPGGLSKGVFVIQNSLKKDEVSPTEICMPAKFRMAPHNEKPTFHKPHSQISHIILGDHNFAIYFDYLLYYCPILADQCYYAGHTLVDPEILSDVDSEVFGLFINWMYAGSLENKQGQPAYQHHLMGLWILAKQLNMLELQDTSIDTLEARRQIDSGTIQVKTFWYIYNNTVEGDMLRKYVVDICVRSKEGFSQETEDECFPKELVEGIRNAELIKMKNEGDVLDMTRYHVVMVE